MAARIGDGWAPVLRGIELRSGIKGVFKIFVDGALVYDNGTTAEVPGEDEVVPAVQQRLGPPLNWRAS